MMGSVAASESDLMRALLDLAQDIAGHGDLDTLCDGLSKSLRRVVDFDFLGLVLQDAATGQLQLHALNEFGPRRFDQPELPPHASNPVGWVWENQEPLVLTSSIRDPHWCEMQPLLDDKGIRSIVMVPLTNGSHRVGILGFGSFSEFQPSAETIAFLRRVASEFSVAVESYLARQNLQLERDRLEVLFDIGNTLVGTLSWDELLGEISDQLKRVVDHHLAVLTVLEKDTGNLRRCGLRVPEGDAWMPAGASLSPAGLPSDDALRTCQPVIIGKHDRDRYSSPLVRQAIDAGFHHGCTIPLLSRNGPIGTLELGRVSDRAFTESEVKLLMQVGRQLAVAMENSLAYQELAKMRDTLASEKLYLEDELSADHNFENMVGDSLAFQSVMNSARIVAATDATVLITGETGTGKELFARALHNLSPRRERSFIKVNCAAIPATLLESELFGHEKGSFTGAVSQKMGRFELAHRGTLFLDEVSEIPLELQSKLLRAIQEREFERLGGRETIRADIRFIAATNRDLKKLVDEGKFRGDLYYRLHVFPLWVPPLRDRRDDIPLLARFFTRKFADRFGRPIEFIPSDAMAALVAYDWPGNIRELQNVIERSAILSTGRELRVVVPELPAAARESHPLARHTGGTMERERILQALQQAGGRVSGAGGAAERLGLKRTTLQSRMKKLDILREFR